MKHTRRYALLMMLSLLLTSLAQASKPSTQPLESIVRTAQDHLQQAFAEHEDQLQINISPLDHRLLLNACDTPLEAFDPPGGISLGRTTVGISCTQPKPWTLYVSANVGLEMPVIVTTRDLSRGTPIEPGDLALEVMDTTHLLRGHFTEIDELVGSSLKRTLRRGQVVTPSMLVAQKTVRRGEQITILSTLGTIEVRSQGKALKDGNPGDLIPVRNLSSKKRLQARVVSRGLVSIN